MTLLEPDDFGVCGGPHESTVRGRVEVEEVQRPWRPHLLEQVRGPGAPRETVLRADRVLVGRAPECEVFIDSVGVSRHHMLLTRSGPEYCCEDCDSTNGVILNGVKIQSAVLRDGDQIQISDAIFVYHDGT